MECDTELCLIDLDIINDVNSGDNTWTAGNYTYFWGQTMREGFNYRLGTFQPNDNAFHVDPPTSPEDIPGTFDLRHEYTFLENYDQGDCGASYAISTIAVLSARIWREEAMVRLSAQEVVSCSGGLPGGCGGGDVLDAWDHLQYDGVQLEDGYPYVSGENNETHSCMYPDDKIPMDRDLCSAACDTPTIWQSNEAIKLTCEEDIQREIINNGPVQAFMSVSHDFFMYSSGVYQPTRAPPGAPVQTLHSVMILGWGEHEGTKYWIGRNSWGTGTGVDNTHWGECYDDQLGHESCGYFRISRGTGVIDETMVIAAEPDMTCFNQYLECKDPVEKNMG